MASPLQQQSVQRKLVYFVLIVILFTGTLLVRRGMNAQAKELEMREESIGDVELLSSALRLSLFGSRGAVVCYLWADAQEKQKKHEWNLLDQRVQLLVKLQPHFISPWLFQSWNLSYNVSVEFDRIRDKYFYIARGIELLAEGERQNRDNPEMRFMLGNYTQSKMGISDENNTLRSLYQMSCIDPQERNPARFRKANGELDLGAFEEFCIKHPHLVRRLKEKLSYKTPDDVVDFLEANFKLPSRYEYAALGAEGQVARLRPLSERFPILPPRSEFGGDTELMDEFDRASELGDDTDNYAVSRAWYGYAQDPINNPNIKRKLKYNMAKIIFQGYPGRAQFYIGERRNEEGWFDADGWELTNWFPESASAPDGPKRTVALGTGRPWAAEAWEKAHEMYRDHGLKHGLYFENEDTDKNVLNRVSPADLQEYHYGRGLSNFPHFFYKSRVERTRDAILARKAFFQAEELYKLAEVMRCVNMYERPEAFGPPSTWPRETATGWKRVLLRDAEFRRDHEIQQDGYTLQRKYLRAVRKERGRALKALLIAQDYLALGAMSPTQGAIFMPFHLPEGLPLPMLKGPLDDTDEDGKPLISKEAIADVNSRAGPPPPELGAPPPPTEAEGSVPTLPGARGPGQ
jgi:hypothetical protein